MTGVAYDDRDEDGGYTPGEGLAGVPVALLFPWVQEAVRVRVRIQARDGRRGTGPPFGAIWPFTSQSGYQFPKNGRSASGGAKGRQAPGGWARRS